MKAVALVISVSFSIAILLGACDSSLYGTPVKREYTKQRVEVIWQEVTTETELNAACGRSNEDKKILGCAYLGESSCTIFTYKNPAFETLGHEMLHCFAGRWHS